ncbi:hypothetical protein SAMD00023353_3201310 [Rosellinia necatrix]|uniref:Acetyltransferase n=1 Tax=Rosellinia necatrix TaxID=77044 RepID=A0A1S8A8M8_ROSNE|nr:hypothetical protein SAMD00023353_3201310 [Rosellinia necatrix]
MLGRILLTIDGILLLIGAPIADYGPTHMFNPNWPPHAKFHNGQTINLSLLLGAATLFYAWRGAATAALKREFMLASALAGSAYWLAGLAAIAYPGAAGLDPEFGGPGFPQAPLFAFAAACALLGSWLDAPAAKAKGG